MSDRESKNEPPSTERIIAQTQELVDTVRANQRELDARIAETTELIDRTGRLLEDSETLESALGGRSEES